MSARFGEIRVLADAVMHGRATLGVMKARDVDPDPATAAIDSLPEAEKMILTLADYEGLTDAEIAAALGESEATVTGLHESALQHLAGTTTALPPHGGEPPEDHVPIDPLYLPFSEKELSEHFAPINSKTAAEVAKAHLPYYRKSAAAYAAYPREDGVPAALTFDEMKRPRQIEKDERFWTVAALMTIYHRAPERDAAIAALLGRAFGSTPPLYGLSRWQEAFTGETRLFFEANLPSPLTYREWLRANIGQRQFIPYILEAAPASGLEGPTQVDALLLDPSTGAAVLFEAKVLADCSADVRYDVLRNQITRNIDVMLDPNPDLPFPLSARKPERTLFALLTPRLFQERPRSRLYSTLMNEYRRSPDALARDLPHRERDDWEQVAARLGWVTWEDCAEVLPGSCGWLR